MEKLHKFDRLSRVIGDDKVLQLTEKTVLVLGVGGVGGYVCETLARSGIGKLIIVDFDLIDETNINRQIIALDSTVGLKKELFNYEIDYFVDACDTMTVKKMVITECIKRKIKFISSMGTGNKLDPSKLEIVDIRKTINDPLAKLIRKFVKDEKINSKVMVLSSGELPVKTGERTPGSTAFVPASAGILIASYVVRQFISK